MKHSLIFIICILLSKVAFSEIYELEKESITISYSSLEDLILLNDSDLSNLYKTTNLKEFNHTRVQKLGFKEIWIEDSYVNQTKDQKSPKRIEISVNKKNVRTKEKFFDFVQKLEDLNYEKVFVNGYTTYMRTIEIDLEEDNKYFTKPGNFYHHVAYFLLPDNRFGGVKFKTDTKLTDQEFINSMNINPRLKPADFIKMNEVDDLEEFYQKQISVYKDRYFNEFSLLTEMLNSITDAQIGIDQEIFNYISAFQNGQIGNEDFDFQSKKILEDFNIKINDIKSTYKLIDDNDFNDFIDGRYEYYLNNIREYILRLFDKIEEDKKYYTEIINHIKNNPENDFSTEINKAQHRSLINQYEKTKFLYTSKKNNVFSRNESFINIANLLSQIYQIEINHNQFLFDSYDLDFPELDKSFVPAMNKNKILIEQIEKEILEADLNRKYFYIYMYTVLEKLDNEKLLNYFIQIDQNTIDKIDLISQFNKEIEKLNNSVLTMYDYDTYMEFMNNYLKYYEAFNLFTENYDNLAYQGNIIGIEYAEEMNKLMNRENE